jgi:hypothetical protein
LSNIVTYPLNGIDYDAADAAGYTATRTSGVYSSEEDFAVTAAGGLSVTVSAGVGWVHPARFEGYSVIMREAETLTLALADGQRNRIDRIVLRYDAAVHKSSLRVLQGTPDTHPTAPDISRTALLYDLCLAQITRPAGSTTIVAGHITDTRLDPALCGVMRDGVTGIPTDELLAAARERISALEEKATSSAAAAKDSAEAAKSSETKSAASEKNAKTSETAAQRILTNTQNAVKTVTANMNAAAGSASTAATKAGEASTSAEAAKADADRAEQASTNAANAAMTALQKAKDAGDFKGDKGDTGPQGPSGTIIKAYDVTLAASGWKATSDTAAKNAGWTYQCDATVSGCTAALEPSATVSLESVVVAQKAGLGSICSTGAGFCRFYSEKVPSAAISLRLLLMERVPT